MTRRALIILILPLCIFVSGCVKKPAPKTEAAVSHASEQELAERRMQAYMGDKEQVVRDVQLRLNRKLGTSLRVDGKFGKNTASALKKFQKSSGLKPTGRIDVDTLKALGLP